MRLAEKLVRECRKPEGLLGRFMGRVMNRGHAKLRRWGLSHISLHQLHAAVLDIGCGGGAALHDMASLFPGSTIHGIDHSHDMVSLAMRVNKRLIEKGRIKVTEGTVSSLPFPDNSFDLATAFESYYFWPDLIHDLEEIRRVLKPGGTLLIVNEVYEDERFHDRNKRWTTWGNMRLHTPQGYREFLAASGFCAVGIDEVSEKNWIAATGTKGECQLQPHHEKGMTRSERMESATGGDHESNHLDREQGE